MGDYVPVDLKGKSCAVTGAGGFIGNAVCTRLVAEGAQVVGLDADPSAAERVTAAGARFTLCDTTDAASVQRALAETQLVVHTAALVRDWGAMETFVRVNVGGTRNVLDAAREAGAERTLHLSSVAIWGYEYSHELADDAPPRPCGIPYIDTKGTSDQLALQRAGAGEPVVVIRPGDVYGPGSNPWAVRPLEMIKSGRFMLVDGGRGLLTPVFIDDLVEAIMLALTSPDAVGGAFTVWDGRAVTCEEFFGHYTRMVGRDGLPKLPRTVALAAAAAQELVARLRGRPPDVSRNAIMFVSRRGTFSNRRAREVLSWEPKVGLDEGMRRTEAWFRQQGLL